MPFWALVAFFVVALLIIVCRGCTLKGSQVYPARKYTPSTRSVPRLSWKRYGGSISKPSSSWPYLQVCS